MSAFGKVAILGGGLLGGSLAKALSGSEVDVALWARRQQSVDEALAAGVDGASHALDEVVAAARLVVLCVPVGAMPGLLRQALDAGLPGTALVTDVGSVKAPVHAALGPLARGRTAGFVGSHPMAGSERQGMAAADADLFGGACCFVTNDDGVEEPGVVLVEAFWARLGCRVHRIDAASHDRVVAKVSHFPHVMAAATALEALDQPELAGFGGGGLRDTTRVAGGDATMWAEILIENRQAVAESLHGAVDALGEMLALLKAGEHEAVRQWLERARQRRNEASKRIHRGET